MNKSGMLFSLLLVAATVVSAQGSGGGWGRGGLGGPGGPRDLMGIVSAGPGSRTPVTGAPYSAVETTAIQQKLADGNLIAHQEQAKVYRDKDGRVRIEHTVTPPSTSGQTPETRITIFDPVAGFSYMLNPATMTAVKTATPQPNANSTGTPGPGHRGNATDVVTTDLGSATVNGVLAAGTRSVRTIPAGTIGNQQAIQITREVWVSSVLKVPVQIKTSDPRFGTTDVEVTGILQNDPDPSLFVVPSTYTVTTRAAGRGPGMMGPMRQGAARD